MKTDGVKADVGKTGASNVTVAPDVALTISLADEDATLAYAATVAKAWSRAGGWLTAEKNTPGSGLRSGALKISLSGDLGAGKTCFARGFLQALGVKRAVRSPTYALLELYAATDLVGVPSGGGVAHLDLYRLSEPDELEALGLTDFDRPGWVWLIEWPERVGARLPGADLEVQLQVTPEGRSLRMTARSALGEVWCEAAR